MEGVPFTYLAHLLSVPVRVGDVDAGFVLDTGIGVTLLSESLAREVDCVPNGETFTGQRMSGQEVGVALADGPPITVGALTREAQVVGVLDTSGFPPPLATVGGFLSLAFFDETAFTVDYPRRVVTLESPSTLAGRAARGTSVSVRLDRQGPALVAFLPLTVGALGSIDVEVDMGSDDLILDAGHAPTLGVRLDDPAVRRVEGRDETGHGYVRCFTHVDETIHVTGAPSIAQTGTNVMFQEIIYDGLIGDAFLRRFVVTYDVPGERMIFAAAD